MMSAIVESIDCCGDGDGDVSARATSFAAWFRRSVSLGSMIVVAMAMMMLLLLLIEGRESPSPRTRLVFDASNFGGEGKGLS